MRLRYLLVAIFLLSLPMALARDEVGRVTVVVFFTGLIEIICGLAAIMALFRTIGELGRARDLLAYLEAIVGTALVLLAASTVMNAVLWAGVWLVQKAVVQ